MKTWDFIKSFSITFGIVLVVNILITVLWNYFVKNIGFVIEWESSFRLAILFAVVVPFIQLKSK
jgi:hypothetical protein